MVEKIYPDLAVAILAGGASSRFGSDKALVRLEPAGPTLLEQTVAISRSISDQVVIVGHRSYAALVPGTEVILDDEPGRGPLGGIATAFHVLCAPRLLVLACDMPCLSIPLLRWLIERASDADAVVPRTEDGRWQTLHAVYQRSALPTIETTLRTGSGAVRSIFDHIAVDSVSEDELREIDPDLDSLFSLNAPADLERARECATGR
jgi:molybdopterin-guanine dinucleotide biosynthesis protein A